MANKKINQLVSKTAILSTDLFGIGDATTGQLFKKTIAELQAAIGGAVISVNGLVGTVVLDTDDIQELATPTNKYFTDARARGAISLTVTGNSGASTYSSGTGVLNVPTYTLAGLGGISATFLSGTSGISYNSGTGVISYSGTVYTDASIRALFSGSTGISYNSSTGAISYSGTVYTDSSVRALISLTTTGDSGASTYNNTTGVINVPNYTLAGLGGISYTSLSGGTGITYNNTTGAISYSGTVYTDASIRGLISLTTTGTSGASTYNSTTGVLNIPQYQSVLTNPVTGTGTTNYVAKFTSSSAIGNSNIQDSGTALTFGVASTFSGNITIDKSSPTLQLNAPSGTASEYRLSNGIGTTHWSMYSVTGGSNTQGNYALYSAGKTGGAGAVIEITPAGAATFSGSVTVGGQLKINQPTNDIAGGFLCQSNGGANGGMFHNTTSLVVREGGVNTMYFAAGLVGIGTSPATGVALDIRNNSTTTLADFRNANSGGFGIYVAAGSTSSHYVQRWADYNNNALVTINGIGNLLVGTTTDNGEKLYVSGAIRATGTITANSDISLKKNLLKIENALEKVEQINGYTYELKADDLKRHAGVIAQEIQTVLPEIVNKGNDGILGVEYGNISALLIEAIKEQNIKIKNLETLLASK
jgi:hypothetical protein